MTAPYLLIDGYNLMHAAGLARARYGPGDLERQRTRLLRYLLTHLGESELARTTIVFDAGAGPADAPRHGVVRGMHVVFTQPNSDADTVIEELLAEHSAPRQVRVVSSDHRLQKAARRRRAEFVGSDIFFEQLERRIDAVQPQSEETQQSELAAKYSETDAAEQSEEWLDIFGDFPEARQLEAEMDPWKAFRQELDDLTE